MLRELRIEAVTYRTDDFKNCRIFLEGLLPSLQILSVTPNYRQCAVQMDSDHDRPLMLTMIHEPDHDPAMQHTLFADGASATQNDIPDHGAASSGCAELMRDIPSR